MRNTMKKIFAGALIAVMALAFAACGQSSTSNDPTGTYTASANFTEILNQSTSGSGLTFKSDILADMILALNEDGTFKFEIDVDSFGKNLSAAFNADGEEMITEMFKSNGVSEADFDSTAQAAGYDSFDDMVTDVKAQMSDMIESQLGEQLKDTASATGTYTIEDNVLTLTGDDASFGSDTGTINADGTITIKMNVTGEEQELVFSK